MRKPARIMMLALIGATLAGLVGARVEVPVYTARQLRDPAFVQAEIQRFEDIRKRLIQEYDRASPLMRAAMRSDDEKVEMALLMLRYVEKNGFSFQNEELRAFEFFAFSQFPQQGAAKPRKRTAGGVPASNSPNDEGRSTGDDVSKHRVEEQDGRILVDGEAAGGGRSDRRGAFGFPGKEAGTRGFILWLILLISVMLILGILIWTTVLFAGLRFVGGNNLEFGYILGTVLRIILPALVPCLGLILVGWIIDRRHETGWGGAIVAYLVASALLCGAGYLLMLLTGK